MPNKNICTIIGHMGADPECKYAANGTAILNVSVATSSGKDDKKQTEWHRITAFGDTAELIANNFSKGDAIHIEGPIKTRSYEDVHGDKKYTTEIYAWYVCKPLYKKRDSSQPPKQTQQQPVTEDSDLPF